ncbi:hypothetical protein [Nocardioides sp.]|uniref:hypothetical protein n=1 Tax=Nocardioides sp. TaxID=35761 RepID=UPI002ED3135F
MGDLADEQATRRVGGVSRRALLVAAPLAVGGAVLVPWLMRDRGPVRVQPLASQAVHEGYGVCQHVHFQSRVYQHQDAIMERYGQMAVAQMRSMYVPDLPTFDDAVAGARKHGVRWNATVATVDSTQAEIEQRIAHMAADNPDVIGWVEGVNEPNKGDGWVEPCLELQRWIHDAVRSHPELDHVELLGPSMHDVRLANSDGEHWRQLADAGVADYMDVCSVHSYPGASTPDHKREERVGWVYDAFGDDYPIKFSEWGYTNTLGQPESARSGGARSISPQASAAYDCQAVLDFANHGWELLRYEFLDDPDPDELTTEYNYGLWEVESTTGDPDLTWTPKPVVKPLTHLLRALRDPGEPYETTPVTLDIDAPDEVRSCVTQKRDGSTTVWLWRHGEIWDPEQEVERDTDPATVSVEHAGRTETVTVGPMPVAIELDSA